MCGASDQMKSLGAQQDTAYSTLLNQSGAEFGDASQIFSDINSAFQPILANGPNQLGYSPGAKAAMDASVVDSEGQAARNAKAATGNAIASVGGGNNILPSGTADAITARTNQDFAQKTASGEQEIVKDDYAQGRQNFDTAAQALSGATNVFNPATSASNAATNAGSAAVSTQNDIQQANDSWMTPVAGILGGVASTATAGIMKKQGWS